MKIKFSTVTVSLIVAILATFILGWNCKVFATESVNGTEKTYNQFEMPIIEINTASKNKISSDEEFTDAQISIINSKGNHEMTNMGMSIRLRGNSTLNLEKASYKIKFEDKQNPLNIGTGKGKSWNLVANYYDVSLLRNITTYRFGDLLTGIHYSPNCRSIELYLNGEYQGVYLLCEDVNISKNRIAIQEEPDEVEKNGYLVKMSRYAKDNKFVVDTASYEIKSDLSETEAIKKQQVNYISNYINKSYNALVNGNEKDVKKYIDIDSLVDIYIGNEIVKNIDVGWDSFYMYKDAKGKLCFGPMWDFDLAIGNTDSTKGLDSSAGLNPYHILNVNANSNPWFCKAVSNKWFRELVEKRWNELQNKIDSLPNTVIKEAESNYKSYCRNFEKWDLLGKQVYIEPAEISGLKTFKDHYSYLSKWLDDRIKWLTKYYKSKDFKNGIFVNEAGKKLNANTNLLEVSPILALSNSPESVMTYKMSPNLGAAISIVNGGKESWHTQLLGSGMILEKGAEYVLSFDYMCSKECHLSFAIQQNYDPYSPYYKGDINFTNKLQHYEATFKAPASDSNSVLAFDLGGTTFNGAVVTFDNMSLIKKAAADIKKTK